MKNLTKTIQIFILIIFFSNQVFSANMVKTVDEESAPKSKYNIEETTEILKSRRLGNIQLDHDDHVYKCMKISKNAQNLEGAVEALVASKTKLGYTLDDEEVDLLIRLSNLDTNLYEQIALESRKIGKKTTTLREHFIIIKEFENGNGQYILKGIQRAADVKYKIENDYFSWERLNLLIQIGKLEKEDRFLDIYGAMRTVGMDSQVNSTGLNILFKLYNVQGDVPGKITEYLKVNKWKSRKQPGEREFIVIKDLMKANYLAYDQPSDYDKFDDIKKEKPAVQPVLQPVAKQPVVKPQKKAPVVKRAQKKDYAKAKKKDKSNKSYKTKSYSPCSAYLSKN